jgi:hypothetical protein
VHPKRLENPDAKRPKVSNKELDAMVARAWEAGWWARQTKNNYAWCYPPDGGKPLKVVSTPSSSRTIPNTRSAFARRGLKV